MKYFLTFGLAFAALSLAQLTSQPIDGLLMGPLAFSDITATTATLEVTSTLDLACVVVYGTDESFGKMALDQTMGSSAHSEHLVNLRGLEPNTEYFYRLQGSDENGTFYASDTLSFKTLDESSDADALGTNVALGNLGASIADVSSNFGGGGNDGQWGADNAIDDDPNTEWSSDGDGNEAFITVELPETVTVSGFGVWTRTMGSSAQIGTFEVENEAGEVFGPFDLPDAAGLYTFAAEGQGKRFRFKVQNSSGGNTGIVELAIYTPDQP